MSDISRNDGIKNINNILLLALSFFISISIYITDLVIILLVCSWLISGKYKKKLTFLWSNSFTFSVICFFTYFLVSYFWSDSSLWNSTTQKQILLLMIPILFTLEFDQKYINKAKHVFILGLVSNVFLSVFTLFYPDNRWFKKGHYEPDVFLRGFIDHFDYAIFLCFAIFLLFSFLNKTNFKKIIFLSAIFLITLLNSYGRVGIISFFLFLPIIILWLKSNFRIYYLLTSVLFGFGVSYAIFPPLNTRVNETFKNFKILSSGLSLEEKIENDAIYMSAHNDTLSKEYFIREIKKNKQWVEDIKNKSPEYETSIGQRYLYIKNSLHLMSKRLLFGFGAHQFEVIYKYGFPNNKSIKHPHNNFIFIVVELGLIGVGLLLYIFYSLIKYFVQSNRRDFLKFLFPIYFMWIMLFDNYFLNHNTLVFFCLLSFLIYYDNKADNSYQQ